MSEKEAKVIDKAIGKVMKAEGEKVQNARPADFLKPYAYKGKNYSESIAGGWSQTRREASIFTDDASVSHTKIDVPYSKVTYTVVESAVTLPTETGDATYEATEDTGQDQLRFTASVVRKDKEGNEVYRFESKNRDFVDKIGAVAAKRIVDSLEDDGSQKAA